MTPNGRGKGRNKGTVVVFFRSETGTPKDRPPIRVRGIVTETAPSTARRAFGSGGDVGRRLGDGQSVAAQTGSY